MNGKIHLHFSDDHQRLESILDRSFARPEYIDETVYSEFRSGLLRHIALEEKILLPSIMNAQNGKPHPSASHLRLEHGAFAALLVPPPTVIIRKVFLGIFQNHNKLEESADGIYAVCDALPPDQIVEIFAKIKDYPSVPVMPYSDKENIIEATRRAVNRAGYDFDQLTGASFPK
jgi:hypothetical protein